MQTASALIVSASLFMLGGCKQPKQAASTQNNTAASARSVGSPESAPLKSAPAKPPATPLKAHADVTATRLGTLPPGVGLAVGSRVPDVEVKTHLGKPAQLAQLVKTGPLLLIFYRGGW